MTENHIDETISIDFPCPNCDKVFVVSKKAKLYCSQKCEQEASLVRYVRARIRDGRFDEPDIQDAIQVKFAVALGEKGYYDQNARRLEPELRRKVIERDGGLCCKCGKTGTEIDHINGSSKQMENLQLLCRDCHLRKTKAGFVQVDPEHERYAEIKSKFDGLWSRIKAISPQRACDDSENWKTLWRQIMSEQSQLLKRIREDVEGTGKPEDSFEKQIIVQELNELAELESQIETLEQQKQAEIDRVLTPEILSKVEDIKLDFENTTQETKQNIEILRKRIKESVTRYGATVKGTGLQVVWSKGRTGWDLNLLEEYSKSHPEVLECRKVGTASVSIRRVDRSKKK